MEYENKLKEIINSDNTPFADIDILVKYFTELKESENDSIRKLTIYHLDRAYQNCEFDEYKNEIEKCIAWLEKQGSIISEEEQNRIAKGILSSCAMSFIDYLDAHKYEGKMCVSNGECADIENAFHNAMWDRLHRYYCKYIEKQGEKPIDKIEPKFKVGDWITFYGSKPFKILKVESEQNGILDYLLLEPSGHNTYYNKKYVDENARLWTIQDAKDGDILYFNDDTIVIFKDLYNSSTFHSHCHIEDNKFSVSKDDLPDWWKGEGFCPATKEQRGLFLSKMEEAGYKWDAEKKELRKIEQKTANKVEPKFKVGDWITDGQLICKVLSVLSKSYELHLYNDDYCHFETDVWSVDKHYHLWTIKDAKDGNVLTAIGFHSNCTFIFKGLDTWKFDEPNGDRAVATGYCCLFASADNMEFGIQGPDCIETNTVKPATKEQRDLLFSKMKEAGYEWDESKKELRKMNNI